LCYAYAEEHLDYGVVILDSVHSDKRVQVRNVDLHHNDFVDNVKMHIVAYPDRRVTIHPNDLLWLVAVVVADVVVVAVAAVAE
jgi:hypothetical protein